MKIQLVEKRISGISTYLLFLYNGQCGVAEITRRCRGRIQYDVFYNGEAYRYWRDENPYDHTLFERMTPDIRTMPCTAGGFSDVGFIKAFRTAFKLSLDRAEDCPQEPLISKEDINKAISQVFESKGLRASAFKGQVQQGRKNLSIAG